MVGRLLLRGMLAGLLAAFAAFVFARLFGEPAVQAAIDLETARAAAGVIAGPESVSRLVQGTVGLLFALVLFGVSVGGLFALVFAFVQGRVDGLGARGTALLLACCGYVTFGLGPALKYPANPPAVGDPQSIGERSGLYYTLAVVCLALVIGSGVLVTRVTPAFGRWNASLLGLGLFLLGYLVACLLLPAVDEVPAGFPAGVLWQFRMASMGTMLVIWSALGLVFGALTERALRGAAVATDRQVSA